MARGVSRAGDDLHRDLDLRQQMAEDGELGRIGAHVAHRLDEAVALVGGEVVLAEVVGQLVPLAPGALTGPGPMNAPPD